MTMVSSFESNDRMTRDVVGLPDNEEDGFFFEA